MITEHPCILGAGMMGLTTAIAMAQRGVRVHLLDRSFEARGDRVYALNAASIQLLKQLNVWQQIPTSAYVAYHGMEIWDACTRAELSFDAHTQGVSHLGVMIQEKHLKQALLEISMTYSHIMPHTVDVLTVHSNGQTMRMEGEDMTSHEVVDIETPFLFITEGSKANISEQCQIPMVTWPYHHSATVVRVQTEQPHDNMAYQIFTPEGPLAFLPLPHPHQSSIVWSTTEAKTALLKSYTEIEFNRALMHAFESRLGQTQRLHTPHHFKLSMRHTQQYHGGHWVLMGDAAHTVHPLAGLGLNLGLSDLKTWLTLTAEDVQMPPSMRLLNQYQRHRKTEAWKAIMLMELIKRTFMAKTPIIQGLRGLGMYTLQHLNPIKQHIVRYAAEI